MRVRCRCGRLASTERECRVCGSDHPMRHWHGEEAAYDPTKEHVHPHDGKGHDHPLIPNLENSVEMTRQRLGSLIGGKGHG